MLVQVATRAPLGNRNANLIELRHDTKAGNDASREARVRTAGRPIGASFIDCVNPPFGVWEFQYREAWVVYVVQESKGLFARLFGRVVTRIIVAGLYDHSPCPDERASLLRSLRFWDPTAPSQ